MAGFMGLGVQERGWRKGPWTPEEDKLLTEYIGLHGEGRWSSVSRSSGLNRNGKSCRLRWVNYLRPGLKRSHLTPQEEGIIIELHALWGNKWSTIARYLPGRTDNEIKNYWRTHFKKKGKPNSRRQDTMRKTHPQLQQQQLIQENHMDNILLDWEPRDHEKINEQKLQGHQETALTYPSMEDMCLPIMTCQDHVAYWSDTITEDDLYLWGGLWNLDTSHGQIDGQDKKIDREDQVNAYSCGVEGIIH